MLFRKRERYRDVPPQVRGQEADLFGTAAGLIPIEFDMMLKGSLTTRKGKTIRQYCVVVDGAPRLVTSGDMVDRKTYEALLSAKAIRPVISDSHK